MPIKKKHLAQGSANVNPSEFISDGDQHKIYSNFYLAAKQNLKMFTYLSCAIPALTEDHNTAMTLAARHGDITMLNLLSGKIIIT